MRSGVGSESSVGGAGTGTGLFLLDLLDLSEVHACLCEVCAHYRALQHSFVSYLGRRKEEFTCVRRIIR